MTRVKALHSTGNAAPGAASARDTMWRGLLRTAIITGVVLLLFAPVVEIQGYYVTVGGLSGIALFAYGITRLTKDLVGIRWLLLALIWPLIIFSFNNSPVDTYSVSSLEFAKTYALWIVSTSLIWLGFQRNAPFVQWDQRPVLIILTALGCLQFFGINYFGTRIGYEIVDPLVSFELFDSYLQIGQASISRAIGTYYEPSMFGRVVVTLAAMLWLRRRNAFFPAIVVAITMITSRSFGFLLLSIIIFIIAYSRSAARIFIGIFISILVLYLMRDFVGERLNFSGRGLSSTDIRLLLPLEPLSHVLLDNPGGLPFGANEVFTRVNLISSRFHEEKITNGVYELILYFGAIGISVLAYVIYVFSRKVIAGDVSDAMIAVFLLLSTVASSSFFSIESSLLLYLFIVSARTNRFARPPRHTPVRGNSFGGSFDQHSRQPHRHIEESIVP